MITYDKILDAEAKSYSKETKSITTNFKEKKATRKTQNFYVLLAFLLITIALLIAVSIYYYLIKYRAKQKYLSPFHVTDNQFSLICETSQDFPESYTCSA